MGPSPPLFVSHRLRYGLDVLEEEDSRDVEGGLAGEFNYLRHGLRDYVGIEGEAARLSANTALRAIALGALSPSVNYFKDDVGDGGANGRIVGLGGACDRTLVVVVRGGASVQGEFPIV